MSEQGARSLRELYLRRSVAKRFTEILKPLVGQDPRAPDALAYYRGQLDDLDRQIVAAGGKPPDTVIALKPARLSAIPLKTG